MLKLYTYKVVQSGKFIEIYKYSKVNFKKEPDESLNENSEEDEKELSVKRKESEAKEKTEASLKKTSRELRRLINMNLDRYKEKDKFITLTFSENMQDRKKSYKEFKNFILRLKRYLIKNSMNENFKYICVPEIQDGSRKKDKNGRGASHFHVLFFNLPYVPKKDLQAIWKQGIVDVRKIAKYGDVAGYLCNYLTEDSVLNTKGAKGYTKSQDVIKPITLYLDEDNISETLTSALDMEYHTSFFNEFMGKVEYTKFRSKQNML